MIDHQPLVIHKNDEYGKTNPEIDKEEMELWKSRNGARNDYAAVQKNGDGDITAFKTSTGRVLDYAQALQEVNLGAIQGVNAFKGRDGELYIRGDADGDPSNNLDNLPVF